MDQEGICKHMAPLQQAVSPPLREPTPSNRRKTNPLNVPSETRFTGRLRRVGNSLAFFIPASETRRLDLQEGQTVDVTLTPRVPAALGLLADLPYEPFDRRELWRDRL